MNRRLQDLGNGSRRIVCFEETLPGERFPKHDPRREDIGAAIDGPLLHLLGRHVGNLALHLPLLGRLDARDRLRDTKVEDLRHAIRAHHDVVGRDVAMDDVEGSTELIRRLVRGVKSMERATHDACADGGGNSHVHGHRGLEQTRQGLAMDVLHDQKDLLALFKKNHIQRRRDVGVLDARHQSHFIKEHRNEF